MALTPYATASDLADYLGTEPPADSDRLLARAMDLVDDVLISAAYLSDTSGNPTDANVLTALKKATCQQVEYWMGTGDELGTLRKLRSYSIEGISVTQDPQTGDLDDLCPRAKATLRAAKLLPGVVSAT